ncbi:MAG: hypothetical protein ABFD92_14815 [Planctomycetaceae bacterium]|nr:hypothetical protein [Planctomycetaceae bacterium]
MPNISPKTIVEDGAQIADDAHIGPFCTIGRQVIIGPGCVIENNTAISGMSILAQRCRVGPQCVIGATEDGARAGGLCYIGDDTVLREHAVVCGGFERATRIGQDNLLMVGCRVGAGATIDDHGIFANATQFGERCHVESYVRTSGFALIGEGVRVGAYAFVAAFVQVVRDAPPFVMLQGMPLRVRGINTNNLERCGFEAEDIRALKAAVRELYAADGTAPEAAVLERMLAAADLNPHVRRLAEALAGAEPPAGNHG